MPEKHGSSYPHVFLVLRDEANMMSGDITAKPECSICPPLNAAVNGLLLATERIAPRIHELYEQDASQGAGSEPGATEQGLTDEAVARTINKLTDEKDLVADGAAMLASVCAVRRGLGLCTGVNEQGGCGLSGAQQKAAFVDYPPPILPEAGQ